MAIRVFVDVDGVDEQVTDVQLAALAEAIRVAADAELAANFTVDSSAVDASSASVEDSDPSTEGLRTSSVSLTIS